VPLMGVKRAEKEILRKTITHGNIPYLFQWNQSNHRLLASNASFRDFAKVLWDFLERVYDDKIPHHYFSNGDFARASSMRLANISKSNGVSLAYGLAKEGLMKLESYNELLKLVRKVSSSSSSHGSILSFLLNFDPYMIASEVPVYSEELKVTGHIDLLRLAPSNVIEVLDFKPSLRDVNLLLAMPQVAMYGVLLNKLIPSTKDRILCTLFNARESISFKPDLVQRLRSDGTTPVVEERRRNQQPYQSTLDSTF
jgi:hypothetical protein